MNRAPSARNAGTNSHSGSGRNGALAYRARAGNNQASSGSRGQGNFGRATNPINGNFSLNTNPAANGTLGNNGTSSSAIRPLGSNFFGSVSGNSGYGYGNSGNGYGNSGYGNGYGGGGYGYGGGGGYGGYGYGNSGYVSVYLPGFGWVWVPIRAIRGL
jgi:hypothetical protein